MDSFRERILHTRHRSSNQRPSVSLLISSSRPRVKSRCTDIVHDLLASRPWSQLTDHSQDDMIRKTINESTASQLEDVKRLTFSTLSDHDMKNHVDLVAERELDYLSDYVLDTFRRRVPEYQWTTRSTDVSDSFSWTDLLIHYNPTRS